MYNKPCIHLFLLLPLPYSCWCVLGCSQVKETQQKGLEIYDTPLWVIRYVFKLATFFHFSLCTIYVNTQISLAMATVLASVQYSHTCFISCIMPAAKIVYHVIFSSWSKQFECMSSLQSWTLSSSPHLQPKIIL